MELMIFGPSGVPDEEIKRGLKTLFEIEPSTWEDLVEWFRTTESFDEPNEGLSPIVAASSLSPELFSECIYVLRFILEAWKIHSLKLIDIQRDLFALGYEPDQIDRLGALLQRLEPVKERVYSGFIRSEFENAVLPTLEDIDAVCDMRPIFEDYIYPAPAKSTGADYKKLIGFSYMILLELVTEDSGGEKQKLSFQMTEKSLGDFQAALERAHDQLDILKESTREFSAKYR
jgi:hypothetical protein